MGFAADVFELINKVIEYEQLTRSRRIAILS